MSSSLDRGSTMYLSAKRSVKWGCASKRAMVYVELPPSPVSAMKSNQRSLDDARCLYVKPLPRDLACADDMAA